MISTNIWVGLKFDKNDAESNRLYAEVFCKRMPSGIAAAINREGSISIDRVELRWFNAQDDLIGFGAPLLRHAWESGPEELDLFHMVSAAAELLHRVGRIFAQWDLRIKPKVYLMEDHP